MPQTLLGRKKYEEEHPLNMLLVANAPLKRIHKCKLKFKSKSWIILGLQKSIYVKNKLLAHFKKDPILKEEFYINYKKYGNLLSIVMKKSKQAYYDILKEIGIIYIVKWDKVQRLIITPLLGVKFSQYWGKVGPVAYHNPATK